MKHKHIIKKNSSKYRLSVLEKTVKDLDWLAAQHDNRIKCLEKKEHPDGVELQENLTFDELVANLAQLDVTNQANRIVNLESVSKEYYGGDDHKKLLTLTTYNLTIDWRDKSNDTK